MRGIKIVEPTNKKDSPQWIFQVWASFVISFGFSLGGIYFMPVDFWIKGYLLMGLFFTVGSSFTLSKTIRDNEETKRLVNRIVEAKTEKLLTDFEMKSVLKN
ncbi:MAG: YiaA/YiaB family inner membrane protein [Candidatus Sericytochromatia bacterium]